MYKRIRLTLVPAILALMLPACEMLIPPLQTPDVELAGIALERLALNEQVFLARLAVTNPNQQRIKIENALVNMELEGIEMGSGETVAGIDVPGLGQEFVDVRVVTNLWTTAPQLWTRLNARGDTTLDYRVDGEVNLGLGGLARLKFDETGEIETNRLLSGIL